MVVSISRYDVTNSLSFIYIARSRSARLYKCQYIFRFCHRQWSFINRPIIFPLTRAFRQLPVSSPGLRAAVSFHSCRYPLRFSRVCTLKPQLSNRSLDLQLCVCVCVGSIDFFFFLFRINKRISSIFSSSTRRETAFVIHAARSLELKFPSAPGVRRALDEYMQV